MYIIILIIGVSIKFTLYDPSDLYKRKKNEKLKIFIIIINILIHHTYMLNIIASYIEELFITFHYDNL